MTFRTKIFTFNAKCDSSKENAVFAAITLTNIDVQLYKCNYTFRIIYKLSIKYFSIK